MPQLTPENPSNSIANPQAASYGEHIFAIDPSDAVRIQYHPQRFIEDWDPETMSLTVTTPNRLSKGVAWILGRELRAYGYLTSGISPDDKKIYRGSLHETDSEPANLLKTPSFR